jgi:hypothetical protein
MTVSADSRMGDTEYNMLVSSIPTCKKVISWKYKLHIFSHKNQLTLKVNKNKCIISLCSWSYHTLHRHCIAPEFTRVLVGFVLLNSMFILLSFFFWSLCCLAFFDYPYGIFNLFNNDISSVWIILNTRVLIVDHRQFNMDFVCIGNVIWDDSSGVCYLYFIPYPFALKSQCYIYAIIWQLGWMKTTLTFSTHGDFNIMWSPSSFLMVPELFISLR